MTWCYKTHLFLSCFFVITYRNVSANLPDFQWGNFEYFSMSVFDEFVKLTNVLWLYFQFIINLNIMHKVGLHRNENKMDLHKIWWNKITLRMSADLCCAFSVYFLHATAFTAVARLSHHNSVCLSVTRVDQSKTVQARITKSSPSAAWKTLVSGTVKLFHKFERGHPERGR